MPVYTIDAANATARRAEDKAKVDKYIEEGPGFAHVNQVMERELRRTAEKESWGLPICCCCCACACMGVCFDPFCPRCNPCGWALQDVRSLGRVREVGRVWLECVSRFMSVFGECL